MHSALHCCADFLPVPAKSRVQPPTLLRLSSLLYEETACCSGFSGQVRAELKRMQGSEVWNRDGFVSLGWKLAPAANPNPAVHSSISYFLLLFRSLHPYLCADYKSSPFPNRHSVFLARFVLVLRPQASVSFFNSKLLSFYRAEDKWITWGRELCLPLLIEQICFPLGCR